MRSIDSKKSSTAKMLADKNRKLMEQISKKEKSNVLFAHVKNKKSNIQIEVKPVEQNLYLKRPLSK
jgi:hypothetical protein